jgi:hypothetical protein
MNAKTNNPHERPFKISISRNELVALVKFNLNQMRRIGKVFQQKALETVATRPLSSGREMVLMRKLCQEEMKKYADRAKGLASLNQ